ncbi:MAG: hypothetical protein L0H36_03685 [bacterium]|nr:hypothetical protein [bacterium]
MAKQQKKKKKLNRFLILWLPIIVVLLAAGALAAYKFLPVFNQEEPTLEIKSDKLFSEMQSGDTDQAISDYDKLIENSTDNQEKASLYLDRAWSYIYSEAGDQMEAAKADALQAEKLDPTVSSALALRTIGEKLKDKKLTAEYGKKYDDRMSREDLPGGP